ncbi:unnamed protein product [Victoria cruziana]
MKGGDLWCAEEEAGGRRLLMSRGVHRELRQQHCPGSTERSQRSMITSCESSILFCRPYRVAKVESDFCVAQLEVNVSQNVYNLYRRCGYVGMVMRTWVVGSLFTVTGCTG